MKVMISGAQHLAAFKIQNKLKAKFEVLLGDYGDVPTIGGQESPIISLGDFQEHTLAHQILKRCLDLDIQMYIPLYQKEWAALERSRLLFAEYGISLICPDISIASKLKKSSKFQDFLLINEGICLFSTLDKIPSDFTFSNTAFSGLLAPDLINEEFIRAEDVANFTVIAI